MRRLPRLFTLAAAALVCSAAGVVAAPASAATWGLSDGRTAMLDAPAFQAVNFGAARLVLPWNAASTRGRWDQWLDRAQQLGVPVMISLNVDSASSCTGGTCTGPSLAAYSAELRELLARYSVIDSVEPWNEPNHVMQPTREDPALAAHYFDQAFAACAGGRCTVVAGNMLDGSSLPGYFTSYRAALTRTPAAWGVHSYWDTTYFSSEGIDYLLRKVSTPLWITETGGLMRFQPSGGGGLWRDEQETAASVEWLFDLVDATPRIARAYYYGLWEEKNNGFDSALLWEDGTPRLAYGVVAERLGPRPTPLPGGGGTVPIPAIGPGPGSSGGAAAASKVVRARIIGKRVTVSRGKPVVVRVRCLAVSTCALRVRVRIGGWQVARKLKVRAGKTGQISVPITPARYRKLRALGKSTHTATVCAASGAADTCAVPVRLARATG